ncbi:GyrI-like domain-containing protein [Streptomyces sp. B6B3]|uniref:GyrI-like domain-containing protein n=1 Tax=Streptomyces sp. B6B3 TaxID=3153570 RepID=UPI00325CEBDD
MTDTPAQQPSSTPTVVERPEQPYVGIRSYVTMETIADIADRMPELFAWLGARGITPVGAPFFRYHVIDMERRLDVSVGVPVAAPPPGPATGPGPEGDVAAGVLPGGRYATVAHTGHPDDLLQVTADLLAWADERGLSWDARDTPEGEAWGCRLEEYLTDPAEQPDMSRWDMVLAFRLADRSPGTP